MTTTAEEWAAVPARVQDLYVKYAADARTVAEGKQNHPSGWMMETEELGPVLVKLAEGAEDSWANQLLPMLGKGWHGIQALAGGPNPLTSMLLSGALMGGLGYGSGYLLNKLFPRLGYGKMAPILGALGGLGGAAGPFAMHGVPGMQQYGIKGLVTQQPLQGGPDYPNPTLGRNWVQSGDGERMTMKDQTQLPRSQLYANDMERLARGGIREDDAWKYSDGTMTGRLGPIPTEQGAFDTSMYDTPYKAAESRFAGVLDKLIETTGIRVDSAEFLKIARETDYLSAGGGLAGMPPIPTDEWGRVVMRDPFLQNPEKALAAGIPAAAAAANGSQWVSPADVAYVGAQMGTGYMLGRLASNFLGFSPKVQQGTQRAGLLAGAVRGALGLSEPQRPVQISLFG
jgi:hypothetical protein